MLSKRKKPRLFAAARRPALGSAFPRQTGGRSRLIETNDIMNPCRFQPLFAPEGLRRSGEAFLRRDKSRTLPGKRMPGEAAEGDFTKR